MVIHDVRPYGPNDQDDDESESEYEYSLRMGMTTHGVCPCHDREAHTDLAEQQGYHRESFDINRVVQ